MNVIYVALSLEALATIASKLYTHIFSMQLVFLKSTLDIEHDIVSFPTAMCFLELSQNGLHRYEKSFLIISLITSSDYTYYSLTRDSLSALTGNTVTAWKVIQIVV